MVPATTQLEINSNKNSDYIFATADSKESTAWKYHLIEHAQQSIECSPNFCGGIDFQVFLLKISSNLEINKTRVHIIASKDFIKIEDFNLINKITNKFRNQFHLLITDRKLQTFPLATTENHEKLLVVDGKYFVLGGSGISPSMSEFGDRVPPQIESSNWKDQFVATGFRDMDVVGQGPIAVDFRKHFFSLYKKWEFIETEVKIDRYFDINPDDTCVIAALTDKYFNGLTHPSPTYACVKALYSKPVNNPLHNEITTEICNQIHSAEKNIRIAHMLFNPDQAIKNAFINLKQNRPNIIVSIISNSLNDQSPMANHTFVRTNRLNYNLVSEVFEYAVPKILYHKKVMTFDDRFTIIGSYNLGQKSAYFDDEIAILVDSPAFAQAVNKILDLDKSNSIRVDEEAKNEFNAIIPTIAAELQQSLLGSFLG